MTAQANPYARFKRALGDERVTYDELRLIALEMPRVPLTDAVELLRRMPEEEYDRGARRWLVRLASDYPTRIDLEDVAEAGTLLSVPPDRPDVQGRLRELADPALSGE